MQQLARLPGFPLAGEARDRFLIFPLSVLDGPANCRSALLTFLAEIGNHVQRVDLIVGNGADQFFD